MEGQCQTDHIETGANVGRGARDLDHEGRHDIGDYIKCVTRVQTHKMYKIV